MPSRPEDYEVLLTIGAGSYGRCQKVRRRADGKVSGDTLGQRSPGTWRCLAARRVHLSSAAPLPPLLRGEGLRNPLHGARIPCPLSLKPGDFLRGGRRALRLWLP